MSDIKELKIENPENIYQEIATALYPHRKEPQGSMFFIVEGTKEQPLVGIRYTGKKLFQRDKKAQHKLRLMG